MFCRYPDNSEFFFEVNKIKDDFNFIENSSYRYRDSACLNENIDCEISSKREEELLSDLKEWINIDEEYAEKSIL